MAHILRSSDTTVLVVGILGPRVGNYGIAVVLRMTETGKKPARTFSRANLNWNGLVMSRKRYLTVTDAF